MNRVRLLSNTFSVSSLRLLGQMSALISGLLIANFFGVTASTDHYYTALILPGALANLLINALTNLFAPIYLKYVHEHPQEGPRILQSMMFIVSIALVAALVISLLAVPLYTSSRDLSGDEAVTQALIFGFVLALNSPLIGYVRLLGVYCETLERYNVPAVTTVLASLVFIGTLLLTLPFGIYSLIFANLASSLVELVLLTVFVRFRLGLSLRPRPGVHPAVAEMLRLSVAPGIAYLALFFIPTVDRSMAMGLDAGSLTAFHFGERIVVAFEGVVLGGPLMVIYYHWANVNAQQGIEAVAYSVPDMLSLMMFILMPMCVGGALLSRPIISILFERGSFTTVDTSAGVFALLLLGQMFNAVTILIVRLLLLIKTVRVQVVLSVGITVLNIVLNFAFVPPFGLMGIALSTLVARLTIMLVGLFYLHHYIPQIQFTVLLPRLMQTMISLVGLIAAIYVLMTILGPALARDFGWLSQVGALGVTIALGGLVYALIARITHHPDFSSLMQLIPRTPIGRWVERFSQSIR